MSCSHYSQVGIISVATLWVTDPVEEEVGVSPWNYISIRKRSIYLKKGLVGEKNMSTTASVSAIDLQLSHCPAISTVEFKQSIAVWIAFRCNKNKIWLQYWGHLLFHFHGKSPSKGDIKVIGLKMSLRAWDLLFLYSAFLLEFSSLSSMMAASLSVLEAEERLFLPMAVC